MRDVLFVDEHVILATNAPVPSAVAVRNFIPLHRPAPTRFLLQEHHATKIDLIQGINIPTPKGTDNTPHIMAPDIKDISAGHSPAAITTATKAAVSEDTLHIPHPATTATCTTLQPMDAAITTYAVTPTGIVIPHPALTTIPADVSHTTPQTRAGVIPATPTTLYRKHSQEKPSYTQDLQPPINPTIPRLSPSRIPLLILHQIQTVTLIL